MKPMMAMKSTKVVVKAKSGKSFPDLNRDGKVTKKGSKFKSLELLIMPNSKLYKS